MPSFRAEMEAMMTAYLDAYMAHDAAGCAAKYAEDATIYASFGPPISGRRAIAAAHEDWFTGGEKNKRIDIIDCAASGDLAYCLISYASDITTKDGSVSQETGTNLNVLARNAGAWHIKHSSMNQTFSD